MGAQRLRLINSFPQIDANIAGPTKSLNLRELLTDKMDIETHIINNIKVAEVIAADIIIKSTEDGLDLLGNLYYQDFDRIILYEKNITPAFFDLKTGIAGEILQKFSNYRVRLAIIGDFEKYESKSIKDFIFESNKSRHINFVNSLADALNGFKA